MRRNLGCDLWVVVGSRLAVVLAALAAANCSVSDGPINRIQICGLSRLPPDTSIAIGIEYEATVIQNVNQDPGYVYCPVGGGQCEADFELEERPKALHQAAAFDVRTNEILKQGDDGDDCFYFDAERSIEEIPPGYGLLPIEAPLATVGDIAVHSLGADAVLKRVAWYECIACQQPPLMLGADMVHDAPIHSQGEKGNLLAAVVSIDIPCGSPGSTTCDARGHLVACGADGIATSDTKCALGCATAAPACAQMEVSNGLNRFATAAANGPAMTFPTGTSSIDPVTGAITINGAPSPVAGELVDGVLVFAFKSLTINGQLLVQRTADEQPGAAIAFIVAGDVMIKGLVDVSAQQTHGGPGALGADAASAVGCGGGPGSGNGAPGGFLSGGGGGGGYHAGGLGGASSDVAGGTAGSAAFDDSLAPLRGGCPGGAAGSVGNAGAGGGGGAIQISSLTRIELNGAGQIDASGGGGVGVAAASGLAGGGGGAGGAILLEAPSIVMNGGAVVLSTKGGGGGGTAPGVGSHGPLADGRDGGTSPEPSPGGWLAPGTTFVQGGGEGAASNLAPGAGAHPPAGTSGNGCGGGGASGEVRLKTNDGKVTMQVAPEIYSPYVTGLVDRH